MSRQDIRKTEGLRSLHPPQGFAPSGAAHQLAIGLGQAVYHWQHRDGSRLNHQRRDKPIDHRTRQHRTRGVMDQDNFRRFSGERLKPADTATTTTVGTVDLASMLADFKGLASGFSAAAGNATTGEAYLKGNLEAAESVLGKATAAATQLGLSEKTIEDQQTFLNKLTDNIDTGVGSMIDANMEEEAARLQALQTQQQLATQALSIANQAPSSIMSLFR